MSRDTSFYYSFLVLPPRKRSGILAVWDFCRAVDDAVDDILEAEGPSHAVVGAVSVGMTPEARSRAADGIATWRTELKAIYGGRPTTRQGIALQPFVQEFNLPYEQFGALIDGVEMDIDQARYQTIDELLGYCRRVASAVGLICLEIFGYRDPQSREYAVDLGIALQLTNIVRDVAADLRIGRIYLPGEDLERFGVTEDALRKGVVTSEIAALLRFECDRARDYYRRATAGLPRRDRRSLMAAEIMGAIYFEILRRIERSGYDVFTRRIRVPRAYRAVLALRVWARTMVNEFV